MESPPSTPPEPVQSSPPGGAPVQALSSPPALQDPWEEIGFQRPLGNFFYSIMITLFSAIVGLFFLSIVVKFLYPYPEIQGYNKVAGGFIFALIYSVFDFGTAYGIERFIAELRVKNPAKMLQYIQFFIWYQMMTGLIQVSIVSVIVLEFLKTSEFAYLSWVFLIICQKQWPGMLGTFGAVLNGLQLYHRSNILKFLASDIIQNLTNVIFILIGRYLGSLNPAIGELMGAVFGAAIGAYVDDFFAMWLAIHFVSKAARPLGFTARDCWRWGFDREVVKRCLWFGLQVSIVPIVNTVTGTWMMLLYLQGMPQYTAWVVLRDVAGGIAGVVNVGSFGMVPIIAESYMNDKKELAAFYITTSIRWNGFLMWMLNAVLIAFMPMILQVLLGLPELRNYAAAQGFIIPLLIHSLFRPFIDFPNDILVGTERVSFFTFVRVFEEVLQVFFVWFFLFGVRLHETWGFNGIIFILAFEHFFPRLIKMVMCWIYIKRTLFTIRINWWQTLVGPIICSSIVFAFGFVWYLVVFTPLVPLIGILPTAAISLVVGIVVIPFGFYLPLTGILGLWDDFSLETFRKSIKLAGPSRWLVKIFYAATAWGVRHSKLHNRFKTPWEVASRQILELKELKVKNEAVLYEKRITAAPWLKKSKPPEE